MDLGITNNKNLIKAFIKFNIEFQGLKADGSNPHFKSTYITLDGILNTVRPLLAKQGLALMQSAYNTDDGYINVKTLILHESGECYETEILRMQPASNNPQALGSLITYLKRYQLGATLGICESVDDDGNKATEEANRIKRDSKPLNTKESLTISPAQLTRLFGLCKGKEEQAKQIINKNGYKNAKDILKKDYQKIMEEIDVILFTPICNEDEEI